jgi:hypothetical protein
MEADAIPEGECLRQRKNMNEYIEMGNHWVGSVQGTTLSPVWLANMNVKRVTGRLGERLGRGQITKGHEHQSKEFVLYLVGNGEPLRVFEQGSGMTRAVL